MVLMDKSASGDNAIPQNKDDQAVVTAQSTRSHADAPRQYKSPDGRALSLSFSFRLIFCVRSSSG